MWHWINVELWGPMWPNIFAPSALTLAAVIITHVRSWRQKERHQQELKDHITTTISGAQK